MEGRTQFDNVGGLWRLSKKTVLFVFPPHYGTGSRGGEIERVAICVGSGRVWVAGWVGSAVLEFLVINIISGFFSVMCIVCVCVLYSFLFPGFLACLILCICF